MSINEQTNQSMDNHGSISTITVLGEKEQPHTFLGKLLLEEFDEHQIERDTPINTETVRLYQTQAGSYVLTLSFQFEGMDAHHHEVHVGDTPRGILASIKYPTDATAAILSKEL